MSVAPPSAAVLARLREEIRRIERRPARRSGCVPCGLEAVDTVLPGGGFPRGALAELCGGPASGKTGVALALIAALGGGVLAAFLDGRGTLHPPAARAPDVDLARLLIARTAGGRGRASGADDPERDPALVGLWAAEALLG